MKTIELDLTGCKNSGEIHERIQIAFDFPEWYGKNWSAFWDLLWSECDAEKVIVKALDNSSNEVKEALLKMREILERHKNELANKNESFLYEIIS